MAKQRMTIEWVRRIKALKRQGFNVYVTTDAEGMIIHIRKKPSISQVVSYASNT
jgi:glucan phosphorylase